MPKRVRSGGVRLRGLSLCITAPKERRSGGEPMATQCSI